MNEPGDRADSMPDMSDAPIWVMSYAWRDSSGLPHFETEVTRGHPLMVLESWKHDDPNNQDHAILWYRKLDADELADRGLAAYLEFTITENYGEFHEWTSNA